MKAKELRDIAARLLRIADEMEGIKAEGGTLRVTIPQPDLFSQMGLTTDDTLGRVDDLIAGARPETDIPAEPQPLLFAGITTTHKDADGTLRSETKAVMPPYNELPTIPAEQLLPKKRKTWKRIGCRMKDEAIVAAEKVGRKSGWCQRSDIERSLQRRNPERSREDIREAVNYAVREGGYMCVKYNSYRFYRTADRGIIIATALARLTA